MSTVVRDERDTSTISSLPIGFYYYLIPRLHIYDATYLGYVDTIQSLTFNPFIDESDIDILIDCPFIQINTADLILVYLDVIE